ncbi:MAG: orotate phosphoribosyltransferase [Fimbriimonadaceae bacterium]
MSSVDLEQLLIESGAYMKGHFKLTSGRHSDVYLEKFRILEQPKVLSALCAEIAEKFAGQADLVAGPTTGGIIIAHEVARQMGLNAVYIETENGKKTLRRSASIPAGARVLVVDDVLTTGLSVVETMDAVREFGGEPSAVGVLIDRSGGQVDFGVPMFASYTVNAKSWAEDEIPDWLAAIPVTKPGTRV